MNEDGSRARSHSPVPRARVGLFVPAWVIVRIHIVELQRRLPVNLYDGFSTSHGEVVHVGIEKGKAAGSERFRLVGLELIAHSESEGPGNDSDVFPFRMKMRRDAEPVRHLQANGEVAGRGGWVAFEHGELRTRSHHWRRRPPGNGIRGECIFFVRTIVRGTGEKQTRP